MANRYANLVGSNKIKDEWTKINAGFDAVQADMDAEVAAREQLENRVDTILNEPNPNKDAELVDIRTPDPTYTPGRTISVAGDITRDMQARIVEVEPLKNASMGLNRNAIINGNFDIWQRGTNFTNVSSTPAYSADRWMFRCDTLSQQATNGSEPFNARYYARLSYDGVANLTPFIGQSIEDVRTLAGKSVTLSFWAKSSSPLILEHVALNQVFGTGGSTTVTVAQSLTIDSATWKKYTLTFALPSISGKTIGTNSMLQLIIRFKQNIAMTVDIAQVQLNEGDTALPFQPRHFAIELALCQRYFNKVGFSTHTAFAVGQCLTTTVAFVNYFPPVEMRTIPTLITGGSLALSSANNTPIPVTSLSLSANNSAPNVYTLSVNVASGLVAGNATRLMANNDANAYIAFDAEL